MLAPYFLLIHYFIALCCLLGNVIFLKTQLYPIFDLWMEIGHALNHEQSNIMKYKILTLLILTACNSLQEGSNIEKFEGFLGPESTAVIDKAVSLTDSLVCARYGSIDTIANYQYFLNDLIKKDFSLADLFKEEDLESLKQLSKSSGFDKELYLEFYEGYIQDGEVVTTFVYAPNDSVGIVYSFEQRSIMPIGLFAQVQIDSLLQREGSLRLHNPVGKYFTALELLKENNPGLIAYLEAKNLIGSISPEVLALGLKQSEADFSDYFVRRIFAVEICL
jgi:hypothetical protein